MKKTWFTSLFLIVGIFFDTNVSSAPRRSNRSKRSATMSKTSVRGTLNSSNSRYTGQTTSTTGTTISNDSNLTCGTVPSSTNLLAKRKCAIAVSEGLKKYCETYPCKSKVKVQLSFNFELPNLSSITSEISGKNCNGKDLMNFCSPFQEELVENLWDLYSEQQIRERKNCNMAKAKYSAAQDCFMYIQAEKNSSADGVFKAMFDASKITELDRGIDKKCGRDAIIEKYKTISIDDWSDDDEKTFLSGATINSDGVLDTGSMYQGKKKLSSTIASLFANIGDNSWNYSGQIGKLADLNLNTKSQTYPRELVTIANTFVTEGETACGRDFKVDMEDTTFTLADNRSALEKEISKKGALKGLFDFTVNNTVGVALGTNAAQELKDKGIYGVIKEKSDKKKNVNSELSQMENDIKTLLASLAPNECKADNAQITKDVRSALQNALSMLEKIPSIKKIKGDDLTRAHNNLDKLLNTIAKFKRKPDNKISIPNMGDMNLMASEDIEKYKNVIAQLNNESLEYSCSEFVKVENENVNYTFNYNGAPDVKVEGEFDYKGVIGALETSARKMTDYNLDGFKNKNTIEDMLKPLNEMLRIK